MRSAYRFGGFHLDPVRRLLFGRDGQPLPLKVKALDTLLYLVERPGELVDRRTLLDAIWPRVIVGENNLDQAISALRRVLGETPDQHLFIVTEPGRGYRFVARVERAPAVDAPTGRAIDVVPSDGHPAAAERRANSKSSAIAMAVLPFVNISGPGDEYFSDGLTEELLNRLAEVPQLKVAARTSSFYFKGRSEPVQRVGRMLGVHYVVSGSVRRSGQRLRVTVRLEDAGNGTTVWSHQFERGSKEIFEIQDEIALAVVDHLEIVLLEGARAAVTRRETSNATVQDLYFRAKHLSELMELQELERSVAYYERAIAMDPSYARVYVGLADALRIRFQVAELHPLDPSWEQARDLLRHALELDPGIADAHALLGMLQWMRRDCVAAKREIMLAKQSDPNGLKVLQAQFFYFMTCGWPPERMVDYAKRFAEADPLNPYAAQLPGIAYWHIYDFDTALLEFERLLERFPDYAPLHWSRYMTLNAIRRDAEALEEAKQLIALYDYGDYRSFLGVAHARVGDLESARRIFDELAGRPGKYWSPTWRAVLLLELGDRNGALDALERAYADLDWMLPPAMHYTMLVPLHGEPRFERLVDALGQRRWVERLSSWLRFYQGRF